MNPLDYPASLLVCARKQASTPSTAWLDVSGSRKNLPVPNCHVDDMAGGVRTYFHARFHAGRQCTPPAPTKNELSCLVHLSNGLDSPSPFFYGQTPLSQKRHICGQSGKGEGDKKADDAILYGPLGRQEIRVSLLSRGLLHSAFQQSGGEWGKVGVEGRTCCHPRLSRLSSRLLGAE